MTHSTLPTAYHGRPLSIVTRLSAPGALPQQWMWGKAQEPLLEEPPILSALTEEGYCLVPHPEDTLRSACLISQLCDVSYVTPAEPVQGKDTQSTIWARPEDIEHIERAPIILCFAVGTPDEQEHAIPWLPFLPPPNLGESALVRSPEKNHVYTIDQLPEAGQQKRKALSQALQALAGESAWIRHTALIQACSDLATYHQMIQEMTSTVLGTSGTTQQEAKAHLATIERTRRELLALEASLQRPDYADRWREIQQLAKELAVAYQSYHTLRQAALQTRTPPPVASPFNEGRALIPSPLPLQAVISSIQNAASGATRWQHPADQPPFYRYEKPSGQAIIEYGEPAQTETMSDTVITQLWEEVRLFKDADTDVLLGVLAQLMKAERNESAWFMASTYLDYRGVQPIMKIEGEHERRAGHRQEDINAVWVSIDTLANLWISISQQLGQEGSGKRKRTYRYTHKGRLFTIAETWTQSTLPDGQERPQNRIIGWRIRAGDWLAPYLEAPNRHTAFLCDQILRYDPHNEMWEKRLAGYFMFHGRMNARGGGITLVREIRGIFDELSLPIDERFPQRTRDRFEKAMSRLVEDTQITAWGYEQSPDLPARKWLETWLCYKIKVEIVPAKERPPVRSIQEAANSPVRQLRRPRKGGQN